ncbi:MAG: PqqD family protein [Byssovorax sp.]
MATGPDRVSPLQDEDTVSLLGPTPATYSYNDALLMGRMTPEELAKVRRELFGDESMPPSSGDVPPTSSRDVLPRSNRDVAPASSRDMLPPTSRPAPSAPPSPARAPSVPAIRSALPPAAKSGPPPAKSAPPPPRTQPPPSAKSAPGPGSTAPPPRSLPPPAPPDALQASRPLPPPPAVPGASGGKPGDEAGRPKLPPPPGRTPVQRIKALIARNDYAAALALVDKELLTAPESPELVRYGEACRSMLCRAYLANLGRRSDVPRILLNGAQLQAVSLDRWAAFVMSRVDGESSIDDIVDITGMAELDTLRILYELVQKGVLGVSPRR